MGGKIIKGAIGAVLVLLGIAAIWIWQGDVLALIRGGVGLTLILAGLIAFALLAD